MVVLLYLRRGEGVKEKVSSAKGGAIKYRRHCQREESGSRFIAVRCDSSIAWLRNYAKFWILGRGGKLLKGVIRNGQGEKNR
jgi:hypothetical protein